MLATVYDGGPEGMAVHSVMVFQTARWFAAQALYGGVLHYRWSGVASQTKVHLSQGGSWHAVHKPSQDLATRHNTCADFPFRKTLLLFGAR